MQWNSIKLKEWYFEKIYFWWKQYFSSLRHRFFWSHLEIVLTLWHKKWKRCNHCNQLLQRYNCWWRGEDINAIPYDPLLLAQILKTRYPGPSLCWDFWSGQLWDSNDEQGNDREPIGGRRLWISHVFATITQLLGQLVENILQIQKKSYSYWSPSFHMAMFITYSLKARGSLKQKLHSRFKFQLDHPEWKSMKGQVIAFKKSYSQEIRSFIWTMKLCLRSPPNFHQSSSPWPP